MRPVSDDVTSMLRYINSGSSLNPTSPPNGDCSDNLPPHLQNMMKLSPSYSAGHPDSYFSFLRNKMNIYENPYETCVSANGCEKGVEEKGEHINIHKSRVNLPPVIDSKGKSDEVLQLNWQFSEIDV